MTLINFPECENRISDKSYACPHCGLPSEYYESIPGTVNGHASQGSLETGHSTQEDALITAISAPTSQTEDFGDIQAKAHKNMLVGFDRDHVALFPASRDIDTATVAAFKNLYSRYHNLLRNPLILQYFRTNALTLRIDDVDLNRFLTKMQSLDADIQKHNDTFVDAKLIDLKDYFEHIMDDIDPDIRLDEEQRRAVMRIQRAIHVTTLAGA